MSTIEVNKITPVSGGTAIQVGESGDTITVPSGATITNSGTANNFTNYRPNAKPFFINGSMAVAQRGTSFSQPDTNNDAYPVDRFSFQTGSIGVYTSTQEALTSGDAFNAGFKMAARIDCTTAQASPAAGDYFWFQYKSEAQDCLAWKKGTTSATVMTLSFWVKSNKTGTAQVNLRDDDNDRMVCALYTISSGDTWEKKVVTFPMETSYPMNNDNGTGFRFEWPLGGGSTYSSGTAPTAWEARIDADVAANNLAINDSTSNDWAITGIQAEVGTYTSATIPPFQHESFGDNLLRCQRYLEFSSDYGATYTSGVNSCVIMDMTSGSHPLYFPISYNTYKRAAPTMTFYNGNDGATGTWRTNAATDVSISGTSISSQGFTTNSSDLGGDGRSSNGTWKAESEL